MHTIIDIFLHLDTHLQSVIATYGTWTYALLAIIVFCETGLVVTPFLPGDSLLFAAGTFAALGSLSLPILLVTMSICAVVGDTVNYAIGSFIGPKAFRENARFLNKQHLEKTQHFYEKYGAKTIILARFVPIVRTFAPFVAGVGKMHYRTFLLFNLIGGLLWSCGFLILGYFFGNIPIVRDHFETVILGIIFVSIVPGIIEYVRSRSKREPNS
jgi:membrane-associated protein